MKRFYPDSSSEDHDFARPSVGQLGYGQLGHRQSFGLGLVGLSLITSLAIQPVAVQPVTAVQLSDGTVYFDTPPSLVNASTSEKAAGSFLATYFFTLSVPANAGEPLQRVVMAQEGGTDNIWFNLQRTRAYPGENRRNLIELTGVTQDQENRAVSVTFAAPIPPGQTVTIALQPRQNPLFTGVYLFGVTAFPQGAKPYGQFLGFGRLQFYRDNFFRFF